MRIYIDNVRNEGLEMSRQYDKLLKSKWNKM